MHGSAGTQCAAPIAHQFSVTRMRTRGRPAPDRAGPAVLVRPSPGLRSRSRTRIGKRSGPQSNENRTPRNFHPESGVTPATSCGYRGFGSQRRKPAVLRRNDCTRVFFAISHESETS
ncbi:hypothetical protein RAJCM14343_0679 [Rhodococcus aetherivorans]|uniref:Uncharacterized protein n=1 Tax=Rhodococcus aetherivorans TaxID=191292 RepID=A0ABQ0YFZ0_9NOCA|nr:hypothetical protein RAJCM14343_0679 [Rhodococcus aetherivorans]